MRHDADLIKELPADSSVRNTLLEHLDWQARELRNQESGGATRDLLSGFLGLAVSLIFGYLSIWLAQEGGWWWLAVPVPAITALAGLVGITDGFARKVRPTEEEKAAEKEAEEKRKADEKARKRAARS